MALSCTFLFAQTQMRSGDHANLYFSADLTRIEIFDDKNKAITVVTEKATGEESVKTVRLPPDVASISSPSHVAYPYYVQDNFYLLSHDRATRRLRLYSASAFSDLKDWELVGSFEYEGLSPLSWTSRIIPYRNNKYLFVLQGIHTLAPEKTLGVKFIEATLKDGKFLLGNPISIDYDGQALTSETPSRLPQSLIPACNNDFVIQSPIITDGYVVIVSKDRGVFWILDTEKGSVRQKSLHQGLETRHLESMNIINPIIANVCAAPDDSIIIAARPKKNAFREAPSIEDMATATADPRERGKIRENWQADDLSRYPQIEWWKLNLKDASFIPMPQPIGDAPTAIDTPSAWFQFKFRVHPDERITLVR
jgi:hypothetical protein